MATYDIKSVEITIDPAALARRANETMAHLADPAFRRAFNAARVGPDGTVVVPALAAEPPVGATPMERARFRMEQAFPGSVAAWDAGEGERRAEIEEAAARAVEAAKRAAALRRFRRAMRRLEKRALSMRLDLTAEQLRLVRLRKPWAADEPRLRRGARDFRASGGRANRRMAHLYKRAADVVARLREAHGD